MKRGDKAYSLKRSYSGMMDCIREDVERSHQVRCGEFQVVLIPSAMLSRMLHSAVRVTCLIALGCAPEGRLLAQTWTNISLSASQRADALLAAMSQSDKIALVQGAGGPYVGNIATNQNLKIPTLGLEDGPAGIGDGANNVTAFPAPITLAASWGIALPRQDGSALGAEARGQSVQVTLAPMMNMARAWQGGRSFEGSGEDPQLTAMIAAAEIQGIQSQAVIATAKHFVANDQETYRTLESSDVDERTLQEIYYPPFRASVRAGVGAVMASYNRVNSRYACEFEALNTILKKSWGFGGFVMSDCGANFFTQTAADHRLDLDIPSNSRFGSTVQAGVQAGSVPPAGLDGMVHRLLRASV